MKRLMDDDKRVLKLTYRDLMQPIAMAVQHAAMWFMWKIVGAEKAVIATTIPRTANDR